MTVNNNGKPTANSKEISPKPGIDLAAEIAAGMLQAFAELAKSRTPVRAPSADRDPWEGVAVNRWNDRERDAMARLGWLQLGWSPSRPHAGQRLPEQGSKPGPESPDPRRVAKGEVDPAGLAAWQALAMISARLAVYGRISVQHAALILATMGVNPANVGYAESPSRFATKLQQVFRCRVTKTEDGSFVASPGGRQPLHDVLAQSADRIIKGQ